jgi:hypothetical protein
MALPERTRVAQNLIEDQQFSLAVFNDINEAQKRIDAIKSETYFLVKAEKIDGKPAFSNEELRQSQVQMLCSKDPEYIKALGDLMIANRKQAEMKMHLGKLFNRAKYCSGMAYAYGHVCDVIAGLAVEDVDNAALLRLAEIKALISRYTGETNA